MQQGEMVLSTQRQNDKFSRYPRNATPWRMEPLAMETFGRLGTRTLRHLRQLARAEVAKSGGHETWGVHQLLNRWCARLSVALHRANARNARRSIGRSAEVWLESDWLA